MGTVEEKTFEIERWKEAGRDLKEFEEMIRLVEQYPLKPAGFPLPSLPYEPSNLSCYNF